MVRIERRLNSHLRARFPLSSPCCVSIAASLAAQVKFQRCYLAQAAYVAFGLAKSAGQEGLNQIPSYRRSHGPTAHADNIHVVILNPLLGREMVVDESGADTDDLVGAYRRAYATAADCDTFVNRGLSVRPSSRTTRFQMNRGGRRAEDTADSQIQASWRSLRLPPVGLSKPAISKLCSWPRSLSADPAKSHQKTRFPAFADRRPALPHQFRPSGTPRPPARNHHRCAG